MKNRVSAPGSARSHYSMIAVLALCAAVIFTGAVPAAAEEAVAPESVTMAAAETDAPASVSMAAAETDAPESVTMAAAETDAPASVSMAQEDFRMETLLVPELTINEKVAYLPDVRAEMSKVPFWANKIEDPQEVLADQAMIAAVNAAIRDGKGTGINDLRNWSQETYNGGKQNEALLASAESDAKYFWDSGVKFNAQGTRYASFEEAYADYFKPMVENCADPEATEGMPIQYAICTTRTTLNAFPTDLPLHDDPNDPDFDYLYLSAVRVNEPLVLKTRSADGKYYLAIGKSVSGWVPAEDVAICSDKDEWMAAWDIPAENLLVIYDSKIYTEDSNFAPETAGRELSMGTCLALADEADWTDRIINRKPYNNHVVWLPIREEDGTYSKALALIGENKKASEGFLPLTPENLIAVMLNQLGDIYGWGGMLQSQDCSGYAQNVYQCFGIEMARNTTWQADQPVYKHDLTGMTDEEKAEVIADLPPGALLIFRGHAMLYLGSDQDKLYVISSVSNVAVDGKRERVRGCVINTLDITRANGNKWITDLHTAEIPYYTADVERTFDYKTVSGDGTTWTKGGSETADYRFRRTYNDGAVMKHFQGVTVDGVTVDPSNYTTETGSVIVRFAPSYLETLGEGAHTVAALFDDGNDPEATLNIEAPQTGPDDGGDSGTDPADDENSGTDPADNGNDSTDPADDENDSSNNGSGSSDKGNDSSNNGSGSSNDGNGTTNNNNAATGTNPNQRTTATSAATARNRSSSTAAGSATAKNTGASRASSVKTGDESQTALWIALLAAGGIGAAAAGRRRRTKNK